MNEHLQDTSNLAEDNEDGREQLKDMQESMDKTLEAVAALSTGLEAQQRKMKERTKVIQKQDKQVEAHQKKVKLATKLLEDYQKKVNGEAKKNQIQQAQITANVQ